MRIFSELTLCFNTKADVQGSGVCVCVGVCDKSARNSCACLAARNLFQARCAKLGS